MKIVLVHPDQTGMGSLKPEYAEIMQRKRNKKRILPLGLLYIASAISGHRVSFIDNYFKRLSHQELADYCLHEIGASDGVVGFGGTFLEWPQASAVSRIIKSRRPDVITVYGGPNATARPEKHVKYFDYVFRGIGVDSFNQFINHTDKNDIPGLCWDGRIVEPCFELDFDKNPWPTLEALCGSGIPIEWHHYSTGVVLGAIGCPYQCRFCASKFIWNRSVFFRDIDSVMREVSFLKSKTIQFREDNFTINRDRLLGFCRELKRMDIRWSCQSRVTGLDDDTIGIMKDAGCVSISCGFESINDGSLSHAKKGHTADDIRNVIRLFEKHRMPYTGGFIVGFPNETARDIQRTCDFIRQIRKNELCCVPPMPPRFVGMPVSEMYFEVIDRGLVAYNWNDGELLFTRTEFLSYDEIGKCL